MIRHIYGIFVHKSFFYHTLPDPVVCRKAHMTAVPVHNSECGIKAHQVQLHRMADQIFPGFFRVTACVIAVQQSLSILLNEVDHRFTFWIMLRRKRRDSISFRFKRNEWANQYRRHHFFQNISFFRSASLRNRFHDLCIGRPGAVYGKRLTVHAMGKALLPVQKLCRIKMILMVVGNDAGAYGWKIQSVIQAVNIGIRIQINQQCIIYHRLTSRPDIPSPCPSAPFTDFTLTENSRHSLGCRSSKIFDFHRLSLHAETLCV